MKTTTRPSLVQAGQAKDYRIYFAGYALGRLMYGGFWGNNPEKYVAYKGIDKIGVADTPEAGAELLIEQAGGREKLLRDRANTLQPRFM